MLSDEMQRKINGLTLGLPVNMSILREVLSQEKYYYIPHVPVDQGGRMTHNLNSSSRNDYVLANGQVYTLTPLDVDHFINSLNNIQVQSKNYDDITNIIKEELDIYFAGNATIQRAAEIIQNRVSILLHERN